MINPFKYGDIVTGDDFCNRKQEQKDLLNTIKNKEKLFIYAERRSGKTSLIKQVINNLPKKGYIAICIDTWPVDNSTDLIKKIAKEISNSLGKSAEELLKMAQIFFKQLAPYISMDNEGKPICHV